MSNGFTITNAGNPITTAPTANRLAIQPQKKPGICTSWSVFNHGTNCFVQLHIGSDADPIPPGGPADGRVPQFVIAVIAGGNAGYDTPTRFPAGLWLCGSSTRDTLTATGTLALMAHLA